jgi:hypothetical protein
MYDIRYLLSLRQVEDLMRLIFVFLLTSLTLTGCKKESICDGKQWGSPDEALDCRFPYPPIGRWHAVYTKEFAEAQNLPPENISTDLSPGVDYMEMDVQLYGNGGTACLVNMLVKKPHDIALYNLGNRGLVTLPEDRKLAHLIDLQSHKDKLKATTTFNMASRDYYLKKRGYRQTTFSMYVEDVLDGYDYILANAQC